jgi:ankyrin repeat protein
VLNFLQDAERVKGWAYLYYHLSGRSNKHNKPLDTPLKMVCRFGFEDLVEDCINLAASDTSFGDQMSESLDLAAGNGHDVVVRTLLDKQARSTQALGLAAAGGFSRVTKTLLDSGSLVNTVDPTGYAPIHHSVCGGHKGVTRSLLDRGADPNISATLPLLGQKLDLQISSSKQAAWESHSGRDVSKLSESEAGSATLSPLLRPETSLHLAALTGQVEIAEMLLDGGACMSLDSSRYDPLKYAAVGGFPELSRLLLERGANADHVSESDGNTALHLAAAYNHHDTVRILLEFSSNSSRLVQVLNSLICPLFRLWRETGV